MKVKKIAMLFAALALGFACAGVVACVSGDTEQQGHDHVWSETYSSNETYHWHSCTVEGCTAISDRATHTWSGWTITTPATATQDGEEARHCTVCDLEQTRVIEATGEEDPGEQHTHTWSEEWFGGEAGHWHVCTDPDCGATSPVEDHEFDEWEITTPATEDSEGEQQRECTLCGYVETDIIPGLGHIHNWSTQWTSGEDTHWHACSGCDERSDEADHIYGSWTVETEASLEGNGLQYRECTVCNHRDEQTIPMHTASTEWQSGPDGHWHTCTTPDCDETTAVEPHEFGEWTTVKEPTATEDGLEHRFCNTCGYEDTNVILATGTGGETGDISDTVTYASAGNESAAFEWTDSNASGATVSYKLSSASSYTAIDEELIRQINSTTARADVLGLRGNANYDFLIETSGGEDIYINDVSISAYDRSGYAHFNYTNGVGAYNDDGTLKDNAIVVYVTEETKNTVQARIGGSTCTGLVNILQNIRNEDNPVVIRVIGQISAATWNPIDYSDGQYDEDGNLLASSVIGKNGQALPQQRLEQEDIIDGGYNTLNDDVYLPLNGLTNRITYSNGAFDSRYNDCSIEDAQNVTFEGVGEDAEIFQWGMTWSNCTSIEVRNLTFEDYTEDACSFQGSTNATSAGGFDTQRVWFHHNTVNQGINYWDVTDEQDKHEGDGGTDLTRVSYVTMSYNHYYDCHKTGLVGGSDSNTAANITFHHNYYEGCWSRLPLGRQANMHMYNNYYVGGSHTSTSMSLRAGAYAFIENCYFENSGSNMIETRTASSRDGVVKMFNCILTGCELNSDYNITVVSSRTQQVGNTTNFLGEDYYYFDTSSSVFYYDAANTRSDVEVMHATAEVPTIVPRLAGTLHRNNNILDGTATTPGGSEGGDEGEGETGGDTGTITTVTYTISVSGTTLNNSDTTGNFGCEVGATTGDATKYSVESDRINIKGNAAYIKLTIKALQGQTVDLKVIAANGGSNNSSIVLTATNVTDTTDKTAALGSQNTYLDSNFSYTVSADGTVEITIMRVSGSSTVYVSDIVVTVS